MLVFIHQKKIAQAFILERFFFINPPASHRKIVRSDWQIGCSGWNIVRSDWKIGWQIISSQQYLPAFMILIMSVVQQFWKIWQIFSRTWFYIDINYYIPDTDFNIILLIFLTIPALVVEIPVWQAIQITEFCLPKVKISNELFFCLNKILYLCS